MTVLTPKLQLKKPVPNVETDWAFRLNESLDTLDDSMLAANVSGLGTVTVFDNGLGNVTISGSLLAAAGVNSLETLQGDVALAGVGTITITNNGSDTITISGISTQNQSDIDSINTVTGTLTLGGADGITIVDDTTSSDTPILTVSGFQTEFVNASGSLSSQITADIATHAGISNAHHDKYTDAEAITALEPTTSALAASGVALDTKIVATSGSLQTNIDTVQTDVDTRVLRAGDTMTGNLSIIQTGDFSQLVIDGDAGFIPSSIALDVGGNPRWLLGSSSGGDFFLIETDAGENSIIVDAGTPADTLHLKSTGRVGIGTNSPSVELEVAGDVRIDRTGAQARLTIDSDTGTVPVGVVLSRAGVDRWLIGSSSADLLVFFDIDDFLQPMAIETGCPSNTLYLESSGEVGIGTANPLCTLDVRGDGDFSGDLNVQGETTSPTGTFSTSLTISGVPVDISTDHGSLGGLGDDDHPQYGQVADAETVTGVWDFENGATVSGLPIVNSLPDLKTVILGYVGTGSSGLEVTFSGINRAHSMHFQRYDTDDSTGSAISLPNGDTGSVFYRLSGGSADNSLSLSTAGAGANQVLTINNTISPFNTSAIEYRVQVVGERT